jgi:transposase
MQAITTIGLGIAKSVFQVHGVDAAGQVVIRRQLKRRYVLAFFQKLPPCLVGIEAGASSHYWSRELQALGHMVRLMPPAYVKPYVKRQKNDMADAEAPAGADAAPLDRQLLMRQLASADLTSLTPATTHGHRPRSVRDRPPPSEPPPRRRALCRAPPARNRTSHWPVRA